MVNLAGALLWIRLMAPNLAQFAEYLKTPDQEQIDMRWLQDVLSFLFAGAPWGRPTLNENYFELSDLAATQPDAGLGLRRRADWRCCWWGWCACWRPGARRRSAPGPCCWHRCSWSPQGPAARPMCIRST